MLTNWLYTRGEDFEQLKGLFSLSILRGFQTAAVFLSDENRFEYAVPSQSGVHTSPYWTTQFSSMKPLCETFPNLTWKLIANIQNPRPRSEDF